MYLLTRDSEPPAPIAYVEDPDEHKLHGPGEFSVYEKKGKSWKHVATYKVTETANRSKEINDET